MHQTGFSVHKDQHRKRSRRRQMIAYLVMAVCVFAVVGTVGTLRPGVATAPTAADPNIVVSEQLFIEEFDNDANGWIQDIDTEAYFEDGEMHLICRTLDGSKPLWSNQPDEFNNVAFQVKATKISGPNQQYGLIFGEVDGTFNLFGVTDNGYYGLMRWTGEEWFPIVDYTPSLYLKENDSNTLTVISKEAPEGYTGRYIELHINGEYLQAVIMDSNADDRIGLYTATEGLHVAFDDFRVWSVE